MAVTVGSAARSPYPILFRIETGRSRPQPGNVRTLLELYGVTGAERDGLIQLTREARQPGWWHSFRDVLPNPYEVYIGLETGAASIRNFEPMVVPGLLQTADYAREILSCLATVRAGSTQPRRRGWRPTSMMPRVDGLKPGLAGLACRGAMAAVCVAVLAAGCGAGGPESSGHSGTSAASIGAAPGGGGQVNTAATAAALADGRWSVRPASPLGGRQGPVVAWTGKELLEIGGTGGKAGPGDGAAFDPADGRWRRIAPAPVPVPTGAAAASVWTGSRLFVFGGQPLSEKTTLERASLYDPASDRWAVTAAAPFGTGLRQPATVWTGRLVVVAGLAGSRVEVASYDPAAGKWRRQDPPLPAAHPALGIAMVATPGRVVVWSLWGRTQQTGPNSFAGYSGIDVRVLTGGRWRDVDGWPQHQIVPPPLYTGRQILVPPGQIWCGTCSHPAGDQPGLLADPGTLRVTRLPRGPLDDTGPVMVWTGGAALAINTDAEISGPGITVRPGDMAAWDPASGAWRRLPGAHRALEGDAAPVWTGRELLALTADGALLSFARRLRGHKYQARSGELNLHLPCTLRAC